MSAKIIAAIYARRSHEQNVSEDAKSVTRQSDNARKFATAKGWTVDDRYIFKDDGISGAETIRLVERQRMIDMVLNESCSFQVIVMQAQDRFSRRDGHKAFAELEQLAEHVQVWFYSEDRQFTSGTFESNVTGILKSEFAAEYRRAVAAKTYEAMRRRAEKGWVTGGRVFGYDNVRLDGHVERRINDAEAAVIRDIYQRYADGEGLKQIAHGLTVQKVSAPRPQGGRVGWDIGTVHAVLRRPLYRGLIVYDKTKKRDKHGSRHRGRQQPKPPSAWLTVPVPQLRIVEPDVVAAVEKRLEQQRHKYLRGPKGRLLGSPRGHGHHHHGVHRLLAGFIVCQCGATFEAVKGRYVCSRRRRKGPTACPCELSFAVETIDQVFLDALEDVVLSPTFVGRVLDATFAHDPSGERTALAEERDRLAREIENLTKAIAAGGDIPALADALKERDSRFRRLQSELVRPVIVPDREALKAALELRTADWRNILRGPHIQQARMVLQHLIDLPIKALTETPTPKYVDAPGVLWGDPRTYQPKGKWTAAAKPEGLTVGLIQSVASPVPASWNQIASWLKQINDLRQAA